MSSTAQTPVSTQIWRNQVSLHWPVDHATLRAMIPLAFEIVDFEGTSWVSLSAFEVAAIEVSSPIPLPSIDPFAQIELSTRVRIGSRDGIWYFAIDGSSNTAAAAASRLFSLPYQRADVGIATDGRETPTIAVTAKREGSSPAALQLAIRAEGPMIDPHPGTIEHYLLSSSGVFIMRDGVPMHVGVTRESWRWSRAEVVKLEETWLWASGFTTRPQRPLAFLVREIRPAIYAPQRVDSATVS